MGEEETPQNEESKDEQSEEKTAPETVKIVLESGSVVKYNGHPFTLVYDTVFEAVPPVGEQEDEADAEVEAPAEPAAPAEAVEKPAETAPAQ